MNRDLWRHTEGERVWLRRLAADMTAEDFAKASGVCRTTLWRFETDQKEVPPGLPMPGAGCAGRLGHLCALARRRSGLGLQAIEKATGRSRPTVLALEKAGAPEMVAFWRSRGFRFKG